MRVHIILNGQGGELDRSTIECDEDRADDAATDEIIRLLNASPMRGGWSLAIGDTITIQEAK